MRTAVLQMLAGISHRGPDNQGVWVSSQHGLALGHQRLSIVDTSAAGHQPMVSASGRFVLTFNGEIYNAAELRDALERAGAAPAWRGHSDTEVLLAGFEAWGVEAMLRRCNGMFAFALFDLVDRTLTVARDRVGEKPLYLGWVGGCFCLASELKAFTGLSGWTAKMAPTAIASFLSSGYVQGPQSAIVGIHRLPAGCFLRVPLLELHKARDWDWIESRLVRFWSLREVALKGTKAPLPDDAATLASLEALLADAVRLRMLADVPLGAFLSGGIDSSLVVALMQSQSTTPVRTFTIGFGEPAFDEAPHARAVARHLGADHTELYVSACDALSLVPRLTETFDEPFADNSQIPTMLVSALARRRVTVALSGDGGDEVFAGYGRYFAILGLWRVLRHLPPATRRAVSPALAILAGAARMLPKRHGLPYRLQRLSDRVCTGELDALRLSYIGGAGAKRLLDGHIQLDLGHCLPPADIQEPLRRLMYGDQMDYLPDDILHKVDRASMAVGLEARVPLLDHRLVEFAWSLPLSSLVNGGRGKQPLQRILGRYLPRALFDRPKQGFATPIASWLRGPLRDWAEPLLSTAALYDLPMLDANIVRALWRAHLDQRTDASSLLWNVLMLSDWRQRFRADL